MAKATTASALIAERRVKKRTSIGKAGLSRPKNKHAKRMTKRYRGQGK